jgi:hypothetical protein
MVARNRKLADWYGKILRGGIRPPCFQRFETWDRERIGSLTATVIAVSDRGFAMRNNVLHDYERGPASRREEQCVKKLNKTLRRR